VVVPLALIVPFAPVVLESGVILAFPVLTALNAALATNGIAKQQSNTKNNIIILCLLVGSTLELRLPSLSSQYFVGKASYFLGMGGVRATTVIVAAICVSLHHRWKVRPLEPENEVAKEELSRSGMTSTGCLRDLKHDQLRNTSQSG